MDPLHLAAESARRVAAYDVVVLGAGYAGLMAALGLAGANPFRRIAIVSERDHFVERIRLQEALVAPVAARLPPFRRLLAGAKVEFIHGWVASLDPDGHRVRVDTGGRVFEIAFGRCVYALGSSADVARVKGAADHAYRLDPGDGARSAAALRAKLAAERGRPLRVVVAGGGNTATEAAGEIKAARPDADVLMVTRQRAGDFGKGRALETIVRGELATLGVRFIDGQAIVEVRPAEVETENGRSYPFDICVWAVGVRASPVAARAGLAVDPQGRILADENLRSISHPDVTAVGDALAPVAPTGARYRLSAFAACATGAYAAKALIAERYGREPRPFSFSAYGQGVSIGSRGVGFFSFPDDTSAYAVVRGPLALRIRNLFVWSLVFFLRLERLWPGSALFWIGRRRAARSGAQERVSAAPAMRATRRADV